MNREKVWSQVHQECPEFLESYDVMHNHNAVYEIVLGGSLTWQKAHSYFQPDPRARVMDIGANAGIYSAYCAALGSTVVAYEPGSATFAALKQIPLPIEAVKAAVMGTAGKMRVVLHEHQGDNCIFHNGGLQTEGVHWGESDYAKSEEVDAITLDMAVGDKEWDCVKIDVEGAEAEILLAASPETLKKIKFAYVELHEWMGMKLHTSLVERMNWFFHVEGFTNPMHGVYEALYLLRKNDAK